MFHTRLRLRLVPKGPILVRTQNLLLIAVRVSFSKINIISLQARPLSTSPLPSFLVMEPDSQAVLLARLRFFTYSLTENKILPLTDQELQTTVSAFLDLRPDGYAIHQKSKRLANLECTRAMNSSEDWEEKKDAEKRSRYAPGWNASTPCGRGRAGL